MNNANWIPNTGIDPNHTTDLIEVRYRDGWTKIMADHHHSYLWDFDDVDTDTDIVESRSYGNQSRKKNFNPVSIWTIILLSGLIVWNWFWVNAIVANTDYAAIAISSDISSTQMMGFFLFGVLWLPMAIYHLWRK